MGSTDVPPGGLDSSDGARVVDIVRIKLVLILDRQTNLLEWKLTSSTGVPAQMVALLAARPATCEDPKVHSDLVATALLLMLQEYCEPF